MLAAEDPKSAVVYGVGISGELAVFKAGADSLDLIGNTVASDLIQSRTMLWYNQQLVVRVRWRVPSSSMHCGRLLKVACEYLFCTYYSRAKSWSIRVLN